MSRQKFTGDRKMPMRSLLAGPEKRFIQLSRAEISEMD